MLIHLRGLSRKGLHLICLLVLSQTLLLNLAYGQHGVRSRSKAKTNSRRTVVKVVPGVVSGDLQKNRKMTIALYPCQGEEPGNVLGINEQWKVSDRVAALVKKLREPDPKTRACAARLLREIAPDAKVAVPELIRLTRDEPNQGVKGNVRDTLWAIGPGLELNVSEFLELIKDQDVYVRLYASFALGYTRPHISNEKVVIQALMSAAKDQDDTVRVMSVRGLGRVGPMAKDAVPVLIPILQGKDKQLRNEATVTVGNIGAGAAAAAPALLEQVYNPDDLDSEITAAITLGRIGPAILPLLETEIKTHPHHILRILWYFIPEGAPVVIEAMRMQNKGVRKKAIEMISSFGPAAEPAVPLLADALKDPDKTIRVFAVYALERLGPLARTAVPALTSALNDKDSQIRCSAALSLGVIGQPAKSAVPDLLRLMKLPIRKGRDIPQLCAAGALMKMSPETKSLVPANMIKRVVKRDPMFAVFGSDETQPKPQQKKKRGQVF